MELQETNQRDMRLVSDEVLHDSLGFVRDISSFGATITPGGHAGPTDSDGEDEARHVSDALEISDVRAPK